MIWSNMLVPGVPWLEKIIRPLIVYWALILLLRLFGKRELAQLNANDLVVLLMISNTVQNAIIGNDNSVTGGLLGAVMLLVFNYVTVRFLYQHQRIDRLIEGGGSVLIAGGAIQKASLDKELITLTELEAAGHKQGFESLDQVEKCVLEPGGGLAFFGRKPSSDDLRQDVLVQRLDRIEALLKARTTT
jgi:uncharacterized membrane protein YcaP (DUF421 family)